MSLKISDLCGEIEAAILKAQNAKPLTLRDYVLNVYALLKCQIDSGELIDAWVTDAYIDKESGEPQIFVKCIKPAQLSELLMSQTVCFRL